MTLAGDLHWMSVKASPSATIISPGLEHLWGKKSDKKISTDKSVCRLADFQSRLSLTCSRVYTSGVSGH